MSETQVQAAEPEGLGALLTKAVEQNKAAEQTVLVEAAKAEVKMVDVKGIEFKLLEDAAIVTMPNGTSKTISLQDFLNMIQGAFNKAVEENGAEIMLPRNCIYLRATSKSIYVTMYHPEGVYDLHFQSGSTDRRYKIPTPNIVICAILDLSTNSKGEVEARASTTKYFCTDVDVGALRFKHHTSVSHPDGLYLLPFSNIYDNANLCTGDNVMPTIMPRSDLRRLNWSFDVLWNSPFNNDLGLHGVAWENSVTSWYQHLAERHSQGLKFPYEKLRGYRPQS